jgi:hypothetical protein
MKPRILAAALLLAPSLALAQSNDNASWPSELASPGAGYKFVSGNNNNSSTLPAAQASAKTQIDGQVTLHEKDKQAILDKVGKLINKTEKDHKVHHDTMELRLKGLFGKKMYVLFCAGPDDQLKNAYGKPLCHGDVLQVSWSDKQTANAVYEKQESGERNISAPPAHDLFNANNFEIDPQSKDGKALDDEIAQVIKAVNDNGALKSVKVFSSASTLRNTGAAEGMTHQDLSRARAEKAFAYVVRKLGEAGITVDTEFNFKRDDAEGNDVAYLDYGAGESCNGTSGPNPPANYKWTPDLNSNIPGTPAAELTPAGAQAVRDQYNQYQFVNVEFEVLQADTKSDEKTLSKTTEQGYSAFVRIEEYEKPERVKGPPIEFHPFRFITRIFSNPKKNWGSTACPKRF